LQLCEEIQKTLLPLAGFQTIFPGSATVADKALSNQEALTGSAGYGSDYIGFCNTTEDRFGDAANLTNAVEAFKRAKRLGMLAEVLSRAKTDPDKMRFGPERQNLALERDALIARMQPASPEPNPSLWTAVEVNLRTFRQWQTLTYQRHHNEYHRRAATLRNQIVGLRVRVSALAQPIQVRELGEAVSVDVPSRFEDLAASVRNCSLESDLDLESAPWANQRKLPIDETAPEPDALEIFGPMDASMREYNRRLGVHAVRQLLADSASPQMDTLINLIQVADPSSWKTCWTKTE